jgi:hypothetical protein
MNKTFLIALIAAVALTGVQSNDGKMFNNV